jgi:hypothetical protein
MGFIVISDFEFRLPAAGREFGISNLKSEIVLHQIF